MSGSQIARSVEHSPCKRGVPSSSPGLTAHISHPITFGAQCGAVHASLVSLRRRLAVKFEDKFKICEDVCHGSDFVTIGEIMCQAAR